MTVLGFGARRILLCLLVFVVTTVHHSSSGDEIQQQQQQHNSNEEHLDVLSAWRLWWMQRLYDLNHQHEHVQRVLVEVALSVLKKQNNHNSANNRQGYLPVKDWLVLISNSHDTQQWKHCRRMARVIHQETHEEDKEPNNGKSQKPPSKKEVDPSVAVQVRSTGQVSTFHPSSFSLTEEEEEDLFTGMMLQIFINTAPDCNPGDIVDLEKYNYNQQSTMIADVIYELLEPIHMELGIVPKHVFDYAYRPVVSTSLGGGHQDSASATGTSVTKPTKLWNVVETTQASSYTWWQWFVSSGMSGFSSFRQRWAGGHDSSSSTNYETMGDRAFAGGSHGEVWRARRKTVPSSCRDTFSRKHKKYCNDRPLIMKRLKVEHGYPLLEAGLREIYFGSLLGQQQEQTLRNPNEKEHVTSYVDHFFREVARPSPTFSRPADKRQHNLELWIVFEDAGPSLRSYLYTPVASGDFLIYQHSTFWTRLRMSVYNHSLVENDNQESSIAVRTEHFSHTLQTEPSDSSHGQHEESPRSQHGAKTKTNETMDEGRAIMREVLRQILESASFLHEQGIVHRDIKPSNVMCTSSSDPGVIDDIVQASLLNCVVGDFSSAWDQFTSQNLYANGPSAKEQTDAYAPPEALFGPTWVPFHEGKPQSYDSWSIGVLALELLLGTPNVFSVDQRTTALLTNRMTKEGATDQEIQRALYLAALSQFCIYMPNTAKNNKRNEKQQSWPLRHGDPLHNVAMAKESCTIQDFHHALRARDPLGLGFDSSSDQLLHLIWGLLAWDPVERLTASEALQHPYFTIVDAPKTSNTTLDELIPGKHNALESQMLDPRMDIRRSEVIEEFICPKCKRKFGDWQSCHQHVNVRRHGKFCTYDTSTLPTCINAHSMLPAHPTSGYCDIQGRRRVMEDFHAVQLHPTHQYYGMFDGHTGNLASKYVASTCYQEISTKLSDLDQRIKMDPNNWKSQVELDMGQAFADIHDRFLEAVAFAPLDLMDQSGTTATILFVTQESAVVLASIGDSRAVLASKHYESNDTRDKLNDFVAVQLTFDHVASDPAERKLVEQRGGFVSSSGGIDRVNGTLAVTRSIGDANLAPVLSRVPRVVAMDRTELRRLCGLEEPPNKNYHVLSSSDVPCFLVLASDGLWDVMSNQEAVDMVYQVVVHRKFESANSTSWEEDGGAFQEAAQMLTQEAYVRGSTDNIGVCVVALL